MSRGPGRRTLLSCLGPVRLTRRWYQCRACAGAGGYALDRLLRCDERLTPLLRSHVSRLSSDVSFALAAEHVQALLGVTLSTESCRTVCARQAKAVAAYQPAPAAFTQAPGAVEFQTDAGKVNTREAGWKDLKIACFLKRQPGAPATPAQWRTRELPAPTALRAWAAIQPIQTFRRTWRRQAQRLGIRQNGDVHALGDGASWIWKGLDHALSGCTQTLDLFHATQRIAQTGERLYGAESAAATAFLERGRQLLLERGWDGVTQLMGEELQQEDTPPRRSALEKMLRYFVPHGQRLDYARRLQEGRSIGSGAIEGLAKTLGNRLKRRGARWNRRHVQPMAALILLRHSPDWSTYWANLAA